MFRYNSRRDKHPFGAVRWGEEITLTFGVRDDLAATAVRLFVRKGENVEEYRMPFAFREEGYSYYKTTFALKDWGVYFYRFEVDSYGFTHYVGRTEDGSALGGDFLKEWQITVYDETASRPWGGELVYHIFVDRFCRVGPARFEVPVGGTAKEWDDDVGLTDADGTYHARDFFGGNLKGIQSKLDYLSELGVTCLYLSPIFESCSNHRYDTGDWSKIDPMLGTEADFADLLKAAAERGMRVMLDGVFNHSGSDSIYFNRDGHYDSVGAYQSEDSPYRDWYTFLPDGKYEAWWGIENVPTLNKDCEGVRRYLFGKDGPVAHWSKYLVNWRLDVVDELPDSYLDELIDCVHSVNPSAKIIGEVWEDATTKWSYGVERHYFTHHQLDGVMNYVFKDAILAYCQGGKPFDFACKVMDLVENYPRACLDRSLTLVGSHDTWRAINVLAGINTTGWSKERKRNYRLDPFAYRLGMDRLMLAAALQYTLPGTPSLYYGDELGVQGFDDPINRRTMPWDNPNETLLKFYRKLGTLRRQLATSLQGGVRFVAHDNLLVMLRGEGDNEIAVVVNSSDRPASLDLYDKCDDLFAGGVYFGEVFVRAKSFLILRRIP